MKRIAPFLLVISMGLMVACAGFKSIEVDTLELGEAYLPPSIKDVLVLNNTLPQSKEMIDGDKGCEYVNNGVVVPCTIPHTGFAQLVATKTFAESLADADYFREVFVRDTTIKTQGLVLDMTALSPQIVDTLCWANGVDAVISIDRLLFKIFRNVSTVADNGYFLGTVRIDVNGLVRAYLPQKQTPYRTVLLQDSVFFVEDGATLEEVNTYLPSDSACIVEASKYVSGNFYKAFVPHRQIGERIYFLGARRLWKEGASFADSNKWDFAEKRWREIYEKSTKQARGKAAFNVALARELQGDFKGAIEWCTRSKDLFQELKEKELFQQSQLYLKLLQERLEVNRKLDEVVGL